MVNSDNILEILPRTLFDKLKECIINEQIYEIRLRINKPIIIHSKYGENHINYICTKDDLKSLIQKIVGFSIYAYEEDIRQGFITIKGGHRIGIAGECVVKEGHVKTIRNISSINIRICNEVIGCSNQVMKYIINKNRVYNTIIISPPKCGKTTILRDIVRNISYGINDKKILDEEFRGKKVTVIDERSEIAGCYLGVAQNDLGIRCDILDNCLKSEGLIMAIRSLSPEVIICDEIGSESDVKSLCMAFNSGVNIITTIHGFNIDDLYNRNVFKELLANNIIERVIVLSSRNGAGTIENVYSIEGDKKICLK